MLFLVAPRPHCSSFIVVALGFIRGYKSSFHLLVSIATVVLLISPQEFVCIFLFNHLVGGGFRI